MHGSCVDNVFLLMLQMCSVYSHSVFLLDSGTQQDRRGFAQSRPVITEVHMASLWCMMLQTRCVQTFQRQRITLGSLHTVAALSWLVATMCV